MDLALGDSSTFTAVLFSQQQTFATLGVIDFDSLQPLRFCTLPAQTIAYVFYQATAFFLANMEYEFWIFGHSIFLWFAAIGC